MNIIKDSAGQSTIVRPRPLATRTPERRHASNEALRMVCDGLVELTAKVRCAWPLRYPVPEEIDALFKFCDYAIERVRSGDVRRSVAMLDEVDQ